MSYRKLCVTCGTEYPENDQHDICLICAEERQYIPVQGQMWTTHKTLAEDHKVNIKQVRKDLYELYISPKFGIGQRAFFVLSKNGNVLWDCIPLLDEDTVAFIKSKGGLNAIAFSHPHYYSNMETWAKTFDCPIYIHEKDDEYIVANSDCIQLWEGKEHRLWDDIRIINIGGHFDGGCVLMIQDRTEKGIMLCSDILQISLSLKFIAMMYSYPNNIPLPLSEVERIKSRLNELEFDTLYGAFKHQNLAKDVSKILKHSINQYFK